MERNTCRQKTKANFTVFFVQHSKQPLSQSAFPHNSRNHLRDILLPVHFTPPQLFHLRSSVHVSTLHFVCVTSSNNQLGPSGPPPSTPSATFRLLNQAASVSSGRLGPAGEKRPITAHLDGGQVRLYSRCVFMRRQTADRRRR